MTKQERQAELLEWSDSYYNKHFSLVPDHVYDAKYDSFVEDFPNDPFLKTIGSRPDPSSEWEKATHKIPMESLNKVTNENEFNNWAQNTNIDSYVISEKLDGISIDLEYQNGILVKAITRGDGEIGEDITKNVIRMQGVKEILKNFTGSIRGEVILKQDDFETIIAVQKIRGEEPLKNLRNGAGGIAKKRNGQYSEYCSIVYFDVTGDFDYKAEKFEYLHNMGLPTAYVCMSNNNDVPNRVAIYENGVRADLPYEIDGLVVEVNDIKHFNKLGELHKRPKGSTAYKFKALKKETTIIGITWQLGNSGVITPVAELEPVGMGGVTVKRASLHNNAHFKYMNLHYGDIVLVSRRNDVIPYVEKVVSSVVLNKVIGRIETCPVCDTIAVENGKFLECPNLMCAGAKIGDLKKWASVTGMKSLGIGGKTLEKLYYQDFLYEPQDLYTLEVEIMENLSGFGKRSAEKIVEVIQSKKELPLSEFVGGLNIRNFSTSMVELLVENGYDTLNKLFDLNIDALVRIKGIEDKTAKAFLNGLELKKGVIQGLLDVGVKIKENVMGTTESIRDGAGKLSGLSFCFTGKVEAMNEDGERYTRAILQNLVLANGGENSNSVKSGLMYLVQADPSSQSSKTKKAESLGVQIISDVDFLSMIGK
jgi:DNA ligase (NAD+)